MTIGSRVVEALELLGRLGEEARSPEEKERLELAFDALLFISNMGLAYGFEKYREHSAANGPPLVIATFDSREEADAWLNSQTEPPHNAKVLIAGKYFVIAHIPDLNHRAFIQDPMIEFYLEDMIYMGLPTPVAAFNTYDEAMEWLNSQPEPPRQVFITVAGEYYLAVYHYKVNLRALYPISMAAKNVQRGPPED
ncbi:head protein [Hyalangium sp.]|uniref:head protein n=1 Tax=Hyalangium sp. TaxID=2028555 RepID=UPI002D4B5D80|nr:head protein [Hyalangium sp.]HYH99216.1 head protein [Hyalangium sp.]